MKTETKKVTRPKVGGVFGTLPDGSVVPEHSKEYKAHLANVKEARQQAEAEEKAGANKHTAKNKATKHAAK